MGKASSRKRDRAAAPSAKMKQRRSRSFMITVTATVLIGVGLVAVAILDKDATRLTAPSGVTVASDELARQHVGGNDESFPPMGGNHGATPQTCGFYDEPISVDNAVHSLEHGAVWIVYPDDLDAKGREQIRDHVDAGVKVLASPSPELTGSTVYVTAWGQQLKASSPTDPRIGDAIAYFQEETKAPEPLAACTGVGTPS